MKDMIMMLGLHPKSTKEDIYSKLGIPYVKTHDSVKRKWKKVKLINIYDPSHTVEFRSLAEAGRNLIIHQYQLHTYINDQTLTVPNQGHVFTVSIQE